MNLSKYYACLALLEDETNKLYEELINQCKEDSVKLILLNILYETIKHKEVLIFISKLRGAVYPPVINECVKEAGYLLKDSLEFIRKLKAQVKEDSLLNILKRLIEFEEGVSEEYLIKIHGEASKFMEDDPIVKKILNYIAKDEERHVKLLKSACRILSKKA
ncbi:MAG: ferritin-like domain-containing protein [Candidatus Bathyarchaeia archaeon]